MPGPLVVGGAALATGAALGVYPGRAHFIPVDSTSTASGKPDIDQGVSGRREDAAARGLPGRGKGPS